MTTPFRIPTPPLSALVALAAIVLALWSQWLPPAAQPYVPDEWLRDRLVRAQASDAPDQRLVVIDIDEASLAKAGPWPWPRERLATLLELLLGVYGARGVALDITLPEPADAAGDQRIALLAQHGPVVLPQAFDYNGYLPLRVGALAGGTAAPPAATSPTTPGCARPPTSPTSASSPTRTA
ncbi:CHASE2 domain-containing protein [Duganella sp. CT11-72]|uniref:CHASE2 domain-containing protein n=1 Tax=Duganella sp. CT11-72 TaxID=3243052 RepID=UPI0039B06749